MSVHRLAVLAAVAVTAMTLAGCSSEVPEDVTPIPGAGSTVGADGLPINGTVPVWTVGQWWDHKWFFGPSDSVGFTVKTIVAEDQGNAVVLAADNNFTAALHGAFVFPTLGVFPKGEVTATAGNQRWPWYQFPLFDNKTWTDTVVSRDGNGEPYEFPLEAKATAVRQILTAEGTKEGFVIEARSGGRLFAVYDYVPDLHWMSKAEFYDVTSESDEVVPQFVLEMSARGDSYTGPYFVTVGDQLLNHFSHIVPTAPTSTTPDPESTFQVTAEHTDILAIPFSFAAAGGHSTQIVAPDGRHWEAITTADAEGNGLYSAGPAGGLVFVRGVPGEWRVTTVGAGAFVAGGGAIVFGLTERSGTL